MNAREYIGYVRKKYPAILLWEQHNAICMEPMLSVPSCQEIMSSVRARDSPDHGKMPSSSNPFFLGKEAKKQTAYRSMMAHT